MSLEKNNQQVREQIIQEVAHIFEFFANYKLSVDSIEIEYVKSVDPLDVEFWIPTMRKINRETFYEVVDFLQDQKPYLSLDVQKRKNGQPPRFHLQIIQKEQNLTVA